MNDVKDFGAVGDGIANDTAAIQRAIDAGGAVYFPRGTYRTGSLFLRSNGGLELAPDATLVASTDPADYNRKDFCPQDANSGACGKSGQHLIIAQEQQNVFIRGGRIDGNGRNIFRDHTIIHTFMGGPQWKRAEWHPAQMIFLCECRNVRLCDLDLEDATGWSCYLLGCTDVHIRGLRIRNSPYIPENDGIDLDCCARVVVSDCDISAGDDAFTLRGCSARLKEPRPCEWVTVSNCIFRSHYAHAIRIGVGSGEIRHCQFNGISCYDSHMAIHINSKYSDKSEGVDIRDLAFRNFHVDVEQFAFLRLDYKFVRERQCGKSIRNIVFENVDGHVRHPSALRGNGVGEISGIRFTDVVLHVDGELRIPENTRKFCMIEETRGAFELKQVRDVIFTNLELKYEHPEAWETDIAQTECSDISRRD
ncbi:MAG: hypothetical protein J6Y54_08810 [Lentisphaeria bacterium]|nr:hypothetical protein [Lentisphaeria bacterium]